MNPASTGASRQRPDNCAASAVPTGHNAPISSHAFRTPAP